MRLLSNLSVALFAILLAGGAANVVAQQPASVVGDNVTVLYGGGDLTGWVGRSDLWSAEDGEIVGRTTEEDPIKANTFLIYKGSEDGFAMPADFELVAQFKIEGGNSGIQYRSKILDPDKFIVGGYQADIDFANKFAGILYEEKGRGILAKRGQQTTIAPDGEKSSEGFGDSKAIGNHIHPGEWNEFRVVAQGNRLTHYINGTKTAEVIDQQSDKSAGKGVIALQVHRGPAMVVRFKNISLKSLDR